MLLMFVTLVVLNLLRLIVVRLEQSSNMLLMSVTLLTFQLLPKVMVPRLLQPLNMLLILVTLETSYKLRFWEPRAEQP